MKEGPHAPRVAVDGDIAVAHGCHRIDAVIERGLKIPAFDDAEDPGEEALDDHDHYERNSEVLTVVVEWSPRHLHKDPCAVKVDSFLRKPALERRA